MKVPSPMAGCSTGRGPQRFCISGTPGGSTALTLTGANEAGAATRSGTIHWPGGGGG